MRQPHKIVKHTQTIRRPLVNHLFGCVWPFCGLALQKLKQLFFSFFEWEEESSLNWRGSKENVAGEGISRFTEGGGFGWLGVFHKKEIWQEWDGEKIEGVYNLQREQKMRLMEIEQLCHLVSILLLSYDNVIRNALWKKYISWPDDMRICKI